MSDVDANVSDTPETLATVETLERARDLDPNGSDTLDTTNDFDSHVSNTPETPETPETVETLATVNDFNLHVSETFESVDFSDSHVSDTPETPETPETVETLATVEALDQTPPPPPINLDAIIKKIRILFSCSHDIHYLCIPLRQEHV